MAIHGYVGKPGAGKSYGVTEHVVIPSLKQDRHVVTNIPLSVDDLLATFGGKLLSYRLIGMNIRICRSCFRQAVLRSSMSAGDAGPQARM